MWGLAFYLHVESTCMTVSFHKEQDGLIWVVDKEFWLFTIRWTIYLSVGSNKNI